jgi:hypothetical protein
VKHFLTVVPAADALGVRREILLRAIRDHGDRVPALVHLGQLNGFDPDGFPLLMRWLVAKRYLKPPATPK